MPILSRPAIVVAAAGGLLWTVKALVITARDSSFGLLENVAFLGGLGGVLAACVLVAASLARRLTGPRRAAATALGAFALFAATLALESLGKGVISAAASGDNLGLEEESGILACGVAWLLVGLAGGVVRSARGGARQAPLAPAA
jgi:hypothetical protein